MTNLPQTQKRLTWWVGSARGASIGSGIGSYPENRPRTWNFGDFLNFLIGHWTSVMQYDFAIAFLKEETVITKVNHITSLVTCVQCPIKKRKKSSKFQVTSIWATIDSLRTWSDWCMTHLRKGTFWWSTPTTDSFSEFCKRVIRTQGT